MCDNCNNSVKTQDNANADDLNTSEASQTTPVTSSEYVQRSSNGVRICPYCSANNTRSGEIESNFPHFTQVVDCLSCNRTWTNELALTGYSKTHAKN